MGKNARIILLESSPEKAQEISLALAAASLPAKVERLDSPNGLRTFLSQAAYCDLILANLEFPELEGLRALALIREFDADAPLIVYSGQLGEPEVIELIREGTADYIQESRMAELPESVERVLKDAGRRHLERIAKAVHADSRIRFQSVFEASNEGFAIETLQGRILETNEALHKILGFSAEELQQMTRHDVYHSADCLEEEVQFQRLLSGKSSKFQVEKRFIRKDGRIIWGRLTVSLIRDAGGSPEFTLAMLEDITERLNSEEAHLRYASVVEYSNEAIISNTFDGIIFDWNPAAERMYGYGVNEAKGRSLQIVMPPEKEAEHLEVVERIRRGERIESFETTRLRKDGSLIHVSQTASPIKDISGKIVAVSTISRDITERKKGERLIAAFAKLGEKLSSATTSAEAAKIIVDVADTFIGWDACSFELCTADQSKSISVLSIDIVDGVRTETTSSNQDGTPSPAAKQVIENGARLILRHAPYDFNEEEELKTFGNSNLASASLMVVPVRNGPRTIGILTIQSYLPNAYFQQDLETLQSLADHAGGALERIRAEGENQKLAAFAQYNPNPVLELSSEGAINYWNEAALQMARSLGFKHVNEFLPKDSPAFVKACLASGENKTRVEQVLSGRTISWSFYPVQAIGVVHCYAGDITERHSLEAQLRQSQKMDSVGQLAGGIAHDFNNILTVIQGHVSLLAMNTNLGASSLESAKQISLAADRAANLTRQLLTFSRRQVIQPCTLDLNEVVTAICKMLDRLLGEDIVLEVRCSPTLPKVHADPGMMEQILMNLVVNSRDAMPKGGSLQISTARVIVDPMYQLMHPEAKMGEYVCLAVKDTGTGIPPNVLPHIFEPFYTTKDVGKGTGLGLATVYGIVQQHKGWINATSVMNKETEFKIFLPVVPEQVSLPAEVKPTPAKVTGGRETILVVEDEPPLRMLVRAILERYGYNVLEAVSGRAAYPVWQENKDRIDLLLTDMVMPQGVTGRELAVKLQAEKPDLKVVYCSGYSLAVVGADMVLHEGLNFLQKPYHPTKLAKTVRDCLDARN